MSFPPATPELPRKFHHRYRTHIILFVLTFVTTTLHQLLSQLILPGLIGLGPFAGSIAIARAVAGLSAANWLAIIKDGLWYAVPLLTILTAHEFGHYFACRRYNVDASLPYYIPAPGILTGTFGAVIRIRERFPTPQALFDIAIAGPIAGFLALIPFLLVGMKWSYIGSTEGFSGLKLGDPLLSQAAAYVFLGKPGPHQDVFIHNMALAALFGQFVTALNLLPFGQLDGGHISYALFGPRARYVSMATLGVTVALTLVSLNWMVTAAMMMVMAYFLGFGHPEVLYPNQSLDWRRKALAVFALIMFVVCFTSVPIEFFTGN